MRTRLPLSLSVLALIALLAGCGAGASAGANTSPPTNSGGPVSIGTDHSQYAGSETINVTVTNTTGSAIYAYDTLAGCSILLLQVESGGSWATSNAAPCGLKRVAQLVKVDAGAAYKTAIHASSIVGHATTFPTGTYRLALQYFTSANPAGSAGTLVYSVSLSVTGSSGSGQSSVPSSSGVQPPQKP